MGWQIPGLQGDVFQVQFQRHTEDGPRISWERLRRKAQIPPPMPEFFIKGSWDGWYQQHKLHFIGQFFEFYLELGPKGTESFYVIKGGEPGQIRPTEEDAGPHVEHKIKTVKR